jgi:hypothetical protein
MSSSKILKCIVSSDGNVSLNEKVRISSSMADDMPDAFTKLKDEHILGTLYG